MKPQTGELFLPFTMDATSSIPLYRQLYESLRQAILTGQLQAGTRLPATRFLSERLGVSRTTVIQAFEQLFSEGYVEGRAGSGTFVASVLPDELLHLSAESAPAPRTSRQGRSLSQRGQILASASVSTVHYYSEARAFRPGIPDLTHFPFKTWARLATKHWRQPPRDYLGYSHPAGYQPLREAIADYVRTARGVHCSAEQVLVISGSQQALDLAARVLLDPADAAWMEDPGYLGAREALLGSGARLVPIPVDDEGLDVSAGIARCPDARMVYVTPSFQFPLGTTMSLARRLLLLQWASRSGAWVLEDDYDSEFRYAARPLASLQGLDTSDQVIYIGTFSKVLFPGLRLGYLIVPPDLVDAFTAARAVTDRHSPILDQVVLTDFIIQGHFARHIRLMRELYAERQAYLVEMATRHLADLLAIQPTEAGMHLVGTLPAGMQDQEVAHYAERQQLITPPLSTYSMATAPRQALLLGYTALTKQEINAGIQRLAQVLLDMPGQESTTH
ncbi:MAG TPA: PLP-dependent aminotransferase family protein [Ktedonosporobacter sp.]|nr:PLP-dependent aminotransferase family protein [Ktedonosporobacter sp.]